VFSSQQITRSQVRPTAALAARIACCPCDLQLMRSPFAPAIYEPLMQAFIFATNAHFGKANPGQRGGLGNLLSNSG
jgi:hypothetical protein